MSDDPSSLGPPREFFGDGPDWGQGGRGAALRGTRRHCVGDLGWKRCSIRTLADGDPWGLRPTAVEAVDPGDGDFGASYVGLFGEPVA
jgi:hypothetical protein